MADKKKKLNELDLPQEQLDAMPWHLRSALHDEIKQLRRIPEAAPDPVKGSWI
jgi:hypothetical protein